MTGNIYVVLPMYGPGKKPNRGINWRSVQIRCTGMYHVSTPIILILRSLRCYLLSPTCKYVYLQIPLCLICKADQIRCRMAAMIVFLYENFRGMKLSQRSLLLMSVFHLFCRRSRISEFERVYTTLMP